MLVLPVEELFELINKCKRGRKMKKILISSLPVLFLLYSCSPVSHILVGEKRAPIDPSEVQIYADYPVKFEKIAIIDASSEFSLKDPSFDTWTWQGKTNKIMQRLKIKAAELGANGLVIGSSENHDKQQFSTWEDDNGKIHLSSNNSHYKVVNAYAIFVVG